LASSQAGNSSVRVLLWVGDVLAFVLVGASEAVLDASVVVSSEGVSDAEVRAAVRVGTKASTVVVLPSLRVLGKRAAVGAVEEEEDSVSS